MGREKTDSVNFGIIPKEAEIPRWAEFFPNLYELYLRLRSKARGYIFSTSII